MSLTVQHFSDLTQTQVDQAYQLIAQMVQENDPSIDVKRGAIKDLVLYLSGVLAAANQVNMDRITKSNSLLAINNDPTLADDELVDKVASNYRIVRSPGTVAIGPVVVILSSAKAVIIPTGAVFITSTGLTFTSDNTYTSRVNAVDVVAPTDRLLTNLGNGSYAFAINVVSSDVGSAYKLAMNVSLVPPSTDIAITRAYTAADFTGGTNRETNTELNARLQSGIVYKSLANRGCIEGLIRSLNLSMFDSTFAVSTIGYGDQELQRYHSIFPVAFGGRADIYVRTQSTQQLVQLTKSAVYQGTDGSGHGIWQIALSRDDAPGYYEITRVTLPVNINNLAISSYSITSDTRSYDLSTGTTAGTLFLPDIASTTEAAFTRYQNGVFKFVDTDTSVAGFVSGVNTKKYSFIVSLMPGISAIQDAVSDRTTRYPAGDALIKAPVPCSISLAVNIGKLAAAPNPSVTAIQSAAANAVNGIGFTGRIPASVIVSAIQSVLSGGTSVTSLIIQGRIRKPNGAISTLSSSTVLDVSSLDAANMVTLRTVGFFANASDVSVSVSNIDSLSY